MQIPLDNTSIKNIVKILYINSIPTRVIQQIFTELNPNTLKAWITEFRRLEVPSIDYLMTLIEENDVLQEKNSILVEENIKLKEAYESSKSYILALLNEQANSHSS